MLLPLSISVLILLRIVYFQMSYMAKDKLFPEWKIWTQFFDHESSEGLRLDGLAESHPVEVNIYIYTCIYN